MATDPVPVPNVADSTELRLVDVRETDAGFLAFVGIPGCADDLERVSACDAVRSQLHPQEWALAETLAPVRRLAFVAGRLAAHAAMQRMQHMQQAAATAPTRSGASRAPFSPASHAVLRTARGAPAFPPGTVGSISHTRRLAVALVRADPAPNLHIGVDIETLSDPDREQHRPDLAPRILTANERRMLPPHAVDGRITREYLDAVRIRFSLKEAVYKAIDPWVQRHVRFQEVETTLHDDGTATVRALLPESADGGSLARRLAITGWWMHVEGHCVTGAAAVNLSS